MSSSNAVLMALAASPRALKAHTLIALLGLTHEQVYEALVALESRGLAQLDCQYSKTGAPYNVHWRAAAGCIGVAA